MFQIKASFLSFFFIVTIFIPLIFAKTQWIDPHSLEDDPTIECDCPVCKDISQSIVVSHYIRTIHMLLNSLQQDTDNLYKGHYSTELQEDDYNFMRKFLQGGMQDGKDWDRIDKIISTLFTNTRDTYLWQVLSWKDHLYMTFTSKESAVALGVIFIICVLYKIKHTRIKLLSLMKFFGVVFFFIDYVYTWIYMLKEKELEQLLYVAYQVPPECDVKRMSWMQYMGYIGSTFAGQDRCTEYHKIKDIDIFWSVSPSQIIGSQIGNIVLAPAEKVGKAFAFLTNGIVGNSSWYMMIPTLLMIPVFLFVLLLAGCVFMSFVTGRIFSFNLFHFIQFSFGDGKFESRGKQREAVAQPTINVLIPSRKMKPRLRAEKKTPILEQPALSPALLVVEEVKQDVEDVIDSSSDEHSSSSQQENDQKKTEDEYEVIS